MKTIFCFLCLSALGWIPFFMGVYKSRRYRRMAAAETARAEAVVTGYEAREKSGGRGRTYKAYYPVVSYTAGSREYRATSDHYYVDPMLETDKEKPPVGSRVTVYYDPGNPTAFHLEAQQEVGKGYMRLGAYIIGFAVIITLICSVALGW